MKLEGHLTNEADQLVLRRAISTITSQVDALKQMVNDFREYAKLPVAQLEALGPQRLHRGLRAALS